MEPLWKLTEMLRAVFEGQSYAIKRNCKEAGGWWKGTIAEELAGSGKRQLLKVLQDVSRDIRLIKAD